MSERESLKSLLFSGAYDEVLARTAQGHTLVEAPALIGALSLSGRLEEAESAFESLREAEPGADALLEARFFVVAGLCHAGRLPRALRFARQSIGHVFDSDPRRRYWATQGLGLVRYFEGRFRLARRFARRALAAAVRAEFPYARFLALDLSAHVALQTGEVFAGMRLLSQAEALAAALGWSQNVATLGTSRAIYRLRLLSSEIDAAIQEVEQRIAAPEVSYFTRRNALLELSTVYALRGEAKRALDALERARRIALPGSDSRGKARSLLAHALALALSQGAEPARLSLNEARACALDQLTLLAEIGFVELCFVGAAPEAIAQYAAIAAHTGSQRAEIALAVATERARVHPARIEDGLSRVLVDGLGKSPLERVEQIVRAGLLGLLPWALQRAPGRRIVVTPQELLTENHGSVSARPLPVRPSLRLLSEIATGYRSHESLLASIWGIQRFVPSRHTAVLHTAVSRLRLALAEPEWIVTQPQGYSLAEGVEVLGLAVASTPESAAAQAPPPDDRERVLAFVQREGSVSSADVAKALRLSPSTALRILRKLAEQGALQRRGGGRSTRYEPS